MPGNPHPAQQWLGDRSAAEGLGYDKLHTRVVVADAAEVRNTDFNGQYGGLYIKTLSANFNLDTTSTAADDGVNSIIDAAGNHFTRAVDSTQRTTTSHTVSGASLTIADGDTFDVHEINNTSGAPIDVFLPTLSGRTKPIRIVDAGGVASAGNANTYNITVKPKAASGHTIMGAATYVIDSNAGSLGVEPNSAGNNWS